MRAGGGREEEVEEEEERTASHNWSKVLMGERSHPPCEGWQGNVAGGNGFSQSAETAARSLGAVRLPPELCQRFQGWRGHRDAHCVGAPVLAAAAAAVSCDYYFGIFHKPRG